MIRVGDMVTIHPGALTWTARDTSAVYPVIKVELPNGRSLSSTGSDVMVHVLSPNGDTFWEWAPTFTVHSSPTQR